MNLLLINKNPVVSRMINISAPKADFEIEECDSIYDLPKGHFDVVIVDDEMYDENFLKEVKESIDFEKIGIITSSKEEKEGFNFVLIKPFLPTDLVELLRDLKFQILSQKEEFKEDDSEKLEESEEERQNILELNRDKEEIVAIDEEEEEEPFVKKEDLDEGGVLDKNELSKVQELLEEKEEDLENLPKESEEERDLENKNLELKNVSDEIEEEVKSEKEQEDTIKEEEDIKKEFNESELKYEENIKDLQEEVNKEELKENINEEVKKKPLILEKVENYKKEKKSKKDKQGSSDQLKAIISSLDLHTIRELLDGMEITIKINFTKKKKKKRKCKEKENF